MIRSNRKSIDSQKCLYEVIKKKCDNDAPWTSWSPLLGYPESEIWDDHDAIIYVLIPVKTDEKWVQGGLHFSSFNIKIGVWTTRRTGGEEEIQIISDELENLFTNPATLNAVTFNIVTDATYTGTTLSTQGLQIVGVVGTNPIATVDVKEFRRELTVMYIL